MELNKILTEEELKGLNSDVVAKLESAHKAELEQAAKNADAKSAAKFESLAKALGQKFNEQVNKAVTESVGKMQNDAIKSKMATALTQVAGILESIGIPATEETKRLKKELELSTEKMQNAYAEVESIKKQLNQQAKINRIYELTKGCDSDTVNRCIERFKKEDLRAIDKVAIANFMDNMDTGDGNTYSVDVDVTKVRPGERPNSAIVDKVELALSDIKDDADMDMPGFLAEDNPDVRQPVRRRNMLGEASRRPFKPERVMFPATGSAMLEAQQNNSPMDEDVRRAMEAGAAFEGLGFGRFG